MWEYGLKGAMRKRSPTQTMSMVAEQRRLRQDSWSANWPSRRRNGVFPDFSHE
jgi:hypothetical protein